MTVFATFQQLLEAFRNLTKLGFFIQEKKIDTIRVKKTKELPNEIPEEFSFSSDYFLAVMEYRVYDNIFVKDIVFLIGIFLVMVFVNWVISLFLSVYTKDLTKGYTKKVKQYYTILKTLSYLAYIIPAYVILRYFELEPKYVFLLVSPLLFGAGFSFGPMMSDFISGLFLTYVKGGVNFTDVIRVNNGDLGVVRGIGFRSLTYQRADKVLVRVPNSDLYNKEVEIYRASEIQEEGVQQAVSFPVVNDNTLDFEKLIMVADEVIEETTRRLYPKNPEMLVMAEDIRILDFDYKNSAMVCEIRFYTKEPLDVGKIKATIRLLIFKKFREHEIEFPIPKQTLVFEDPSEKEKSVGKSNQIKEELVGRLTKEITGKNRTPDMSNGKKDEEDNGNDGDS